MVRLKEVGGVTYRIYIKLFQFLMVRLKVGGSLVLVDLHLFQFLMVRLKAELDTLRNYLLSQFQFLMVRLKGHLSALVLTSLRVSIPYGTIKSLNLQKNKSLILLPLRYYKDRKNKRIKCRCPIIMKCRFIDTILNV